MSAPPMTFQWTGEAMEPLRRFHNLANNQFVVGQTYRLVEQEERSEVSHRQEFAWLKDAWLSLPEDIASDYPTVEHLRKRALIATGWCTVSDYVCSNATEAVRWAENLRREADQYTLVMCSRSVVRVFKAKSQSRGAMNKEDFQSSKTAILEWVAGLLDVTPQQLSSAGQGASGANNPAREAA
jgi:hypothetical protein